MKMRKLAYCPYGKCVILEDSITGDVWLQSYNTIVAGIVNNWLFCNGTYSATTRKHLGAFAKEIGREISYQTLKLLYTNGLEMNIQTGEVRPVMA